MFIYKCEGFGREISICTPVFQLWVFDLNRMFVDLLELTKKQIAFITFNVVLQAPFGKIWKSFVLNRNRAQFFNAILIKINLRLQTYDFIFLQKTHNLNLY